MHLQCNKASFLLFLGPYYHIQKGLQRQHILLFKWYCYPHTVPKPNSWCFYLGMLMCCLHGKLHYNSIYTVIQNVDLYQFDVYMLNKNCGT